MIWGLVLLGREPVYNYGVELSGFRSIPFVHKRDVSTRLRERAKQICPDKVLTNETVFPILSAKENGIGRYVEKYWTQNQQ